MPPQAPATVVEEPPKTELLIPPPSVRPRVLRKILRWTVLFMVLAGVLWVLTSGNPFAQGVQEFVGNKHDQAILDTPFSVSAHNFRYYKFTLPEGSTHIAIVGQFAVSEGQSGAARKTSAKAQVGTDSGIEVYVLSESAFAVWQKGYMTSSVYESGRVSQGTIQQDLPAGAGVYYVVFSNKFAGKAQKDVNATVLLRYKNWLPESIRRVKSFVTGSTEMLD